MKQSYYKISNKSAGEAEILIYGVIGDSWWEESITAKRFVTDFKELEKTCSRINIRINSPGGSVFDGLAIFNVIHSSRADVHTYNDGLAASMGAVILLAGQTVHSAKNALLMLHSPLGGVYGTARDIQNYLTVLDKVKGSLITCICTKSGKTQEDIESKYFDFEDHWLSADEAMTENLIDEIEEREAKVPENITSMTYSDIVSQFNDLMKPDPKRFNVLSRLNNLLTNTKTNDEMNLSELIKICNLNAKASEQEVLEHIKNLITENTTLKTDKDTAENALKTEQQAHETTKTELSEPRQQIENLKKAPGDRSDEVKKETDDTRKETVDRLSKEDIEFFANL